MKIDASKFRHLANNEQSSGREVGYCACGKPTDRCSLGVKRENNVLLYNCFSSGCPVDGTYFRSEFCRIAVFHLHGPRSASGPTVHGLWKNRRRRKPEECAEHRQLRHGRQRPPPEREYYLPFLSSQNLSSTSPTGSVREGSSIAASIAFFRSGSTYQSDWMAR